MADKTTGEKKEFEITGKHVLIGMVGAFSLIIGVNVFMAVSAVRTFPGLEVKNSYVASQHFDDDKAEQLSLGWTIETAAKDAFFRVAITDEAGNPVEVETISGTIGRPTSVVDDQTPEFVFDGTAYVAETGKLEEGNWNYRMVATAKNGAHFKQRIVFYVKH
ncbi:FixH family protein [Celeribacter sp.]|uniref:FixH family protein n=1 Tax=Celeribacter sp. TaxID=1890673 RepID=UPI003A92323A